MQSFWQKLWFYTRVTLAVLIGIYVIVFVLLNWTARVEPEVNLVFKSFPKPRLLIVLFLTAFTSILGWWLFWTIFRTIRQIRESHSRAKVHRLEREVEDMKLKAARLQTRPAATAISSESYDTPTTQSQPPMTE